ncbi:glycine N-acyltransferase-like protein 3 [Haliotis rubra]|uniref:glycine N-acyltransferase-like protein 3 n=1 Tax=Haliotis rubra TaxID=36100 RepID=UPI001EE5CE93|nr:glycine N-acyltransferase-like protein 3 [Haliotis rubra]
MPVILSENQMRDVMHQVTKYHGWIKICGEISARLEHFITGYEFIVDTWPEFKALVVRSNRKSLQLQFLEPSVNIFATDTGALRDLLQNNDVIDWSRKQNFECVDTRLMSVVIEVMKHHQVSISLGSTAVFLRVTEDTLELKPVPEGFTLKSLKEDQAKMVDAFWNLRREYSDDYIQEMIRKLPSCCLYNSEGEMVGFAITYHYGCIGMLHVLEEHRGKGYAKVIMSHLAFKCLQKWQCVSVFIDPKNTRSIKLNEAIGFSLVPDLLFIAIKSHSHPKL